MVINDKREILGWTMYDWANSAFSTTVVTALLGPYILALAESSSAPLNFLGTDIEPAAIFPFAVSLSVGLQVLFLPLLGTIADFTNLKKRMMMTFAYIGAITTIFLYFIRADMPLLGTNGAVLLGSALFILANLSFGAAIVFYNAYLPDITTPRLHGRGAASAPQPRAVECDGRYRAGGADQPGQRRYLVARFHLSLPAKAAAHQGIGQAAAAGDLLFPLWAPPDPGDISGAVAQIPGDAALPGRLFDL